MTTDRVDLGPEVEKACEEAALGLWQAPSQKILWPRIVDLARKVAAITREQDAKLVQEGNFVDGSLGTIEGQIARAIREQATHD